MRSGLTKISKFNGALLAIAGVALTTAVLLPFREYLNSTEVSLMLLLIVLFASTLFGSRAGLAAAVAGILSFNFFFLPPYYTLTIAGSDNLVAFAAFVITALIAGQLSGYAKRRTEESEARQREIERLYHELRNAFEQASEAEGLRRSEKLKSSLLDAVTHDLRTPLTSIKASVTTLIDDKDGNLLDKETRREFLEIIDEETDRMNEFVEGMVGMAKVEATTMQLHKKESSVDEIIGNAIERARKQTSTHLVATRIDDKLPSINVDAASIAEVVFTLVDNAAKYSPEGTTIRVSASCMPDDSVEIAVEDQGRGIEQDLRERVFDKFFRIANSDIHTTGSGLGLGLSIAKGIVESQGGKIWIEDGTDGFSTKVIFCLPASNEALELTEYK